MDDGRSARVPRDPARAHRGEPAHHLPALRRGRRRAGARAPVRLPAGTTCTRRARGRTRVRDLVGLGPHGAVRLHRVRAGRACAVPRAAGPLGRRPRVRHSRADQREDLRRGAEQPVLADHRAAARAGPRRRGPERATARLADDRRRGAHGRAGGHAHPRAGPGSGRGPWPGRPVEAARRARLRRHPVPAHDLRRRGHAPARRGDHRARHGGAHPRVPRRAGDARRAARRAEAVRDVADAAVRRAQRHARGGPVRVRELAAGPVPARDAVPRAGHACRHRPRRPNGTPWRPT